jgi:hypothetical protein
MSHLYSPYYALDELLVQIDEACGVRSKNTKRKRPSLI